MFPTSVDAKSCFRDRVVLALSVFLSLILPAVVIGWSIHINSWGHFFESSKSFDGGLKEGEFWCGVATIDRESSQSSAWSMKRLDLRTGFESDTGVTGVGDFYPFWLKDELFLSDGTDNSIYRVIDSKMERIPNSSSQVGYFHVIPFLLNGQLSTIAVVDDRAFQLMHLVEGEWIRGRKVLLLGPGRGWTEAAENERATLCPLTSERRIPRGLVGFSREHLLLRVVEHLGTVHLFITDFSGFCAYRNGFEYFDEVLPVASAFAPENSDHEISGWEPIPFTNTKPYAFCDDMGCDSKGVLFLLGPDTRMTDIHRFWLVRYRGGWESPQEIKFPLDQHFRRAQLVSNPAGTISYAIRSHERLSSATVCPIEGDQVQPGQIELPGAVPSYLARWNHLLLSLVFAWLLHSSILVGGILVRCESDSNFHYGKQVATLAPVWRRACALCVDFIIGLSVLSVSTFVFLQDIRIEWTPWTFVDLGHSLADCENEFVQHTLNGIEWSGSLRERSLCELIPPPILDCPPFQMIGLGALLAMLCFKAYFEGRYGFTPGKWLLRIRSVNSALRPCGFPRSLLGDLLRWIDTPMLITALPAALSIMLSDRRQRLGNRATDTIVVMAGSIREFEVHRGN